MLEEFRELIRTGILRVTPENEVLSLAPPETPGAAEKQPAAAASREDDVALLDKQLLEWLNRRRQQKGEPQRPEAPQAPATLRQKVVDRLARKILDLWDLSENLSSGGHQSLREEVVDRIVEEILQRWQRGLE